MSRAHVAVLPSLLLLAMSSISGAQPRETPMAEGRRVLSLHGERYGLLPLEDASVQRARLVFDKVVRAAGRRPGLVLDLSVLDTPRVVGQALPGGQVVISRGLLDLAGADDSALAFVVGHELAHLLRDHHAALPRRAPGLPIAPEHVPIYEEKELEADRLGVLFAALAGYQPVAAIPILQKIAADLRPDGLHPAARARVDAVSRQLADVGAHVDVFHLGLLLLGTGHYHDAARVLEHFVAMFPAREVLSVAGVAWHKEALLHTPPRSYQHLLVLDASTRALRLRGEDGSFRYSPPPPDPAFVHAMDRAVTLYKQAVDADPGYAPALNNLATAYLDLDEFDLAAAYIARALKADPRLASAYNNRGILRALASDRRRAEEDWLHALDLEPRRREIIQNLARVQLKPDDAKAWLDKLPPLDRTVHAVQTLDGVAPGMSLERVRARWSEPRLRTLAVPLGGRSAEDLTLSVAPAQGLLVAMRGDVVEAVAAFGSPRPVTREGLGPGDSLARLERVYGRPAAVEGLHAVNVCFYPTRGMAVFVVRDRVLALWAGRTAR